MPVEGHGGRWRKNVHVKRIEMRASEVCEGREGCDSGTQNGEKKQHVQNESVSCRLVVKFATAPKRCSVPEVKVGSGKRKRSVLLADAVKHSPSAVLHARTWFVRSKQH